MMHYEIKTREEKNARRIKRKKSQCYARKAREIKYARRL